MQINRLNLIFPPAAPSASGAAAASPDALLQPDAGNPGTPAAGAAAKRIASPAVAPSTSPETPAAPGGVTLELGSGQKAAASGIYTREGVFAGRGSAAVDQTPAEQFVASAVNAMRDFEQGKGAFVGMAGTGESQVASAGLFGGLRQVASKLNVFA